MLRNFNSGGSGASGCPVADHYLESVLERASALWPEDGVVGEKWKV